MEACFCPVNQTVQVAADLSWTGQQARSAREDFAQPFCQVKKRIAARLVDWVS